MPRRAAWSLQKRLREIRAWINAQDPSELHAQVEQELATADTPQLVATVLDSLLAPREFHIATAGILSEEPTYWARYHLAWRYRAAFTKIYLDRFDQLAAANPRDAKVFRLPIGRLYFSDINGILMELMSAVAFHEDQFADWCGRRMLRSYVERDYATDAKSWTVNNCDLFMLFLFARWKDIALGPVPRAEVNNGPYQEVFDAWEDPARFGAAVEAICEYHASHCTGDEDPFMHPYDVFPAEILALKRIREDLGLTFPERLSSPIMNTPLASVPVSIPRVEDDPYIPRVIARCRELMPVDIPWETVD
jgi:hypothetical protein